MTEYEVMTLAFNLGFDYGQSWFILCVVASLLIFVAKFINRL